MHINFSPEPTKALKIYIRKFEHHFSKRLRSTFIAYITCLMLEYKRCSLQAMSQKTTLTNYERLQYFISESQTWDSEKLNTSRIMELQKTRSTKTCRKGALIIDDTACNKSKTCKKTEGAQVQYSGAEDTMVNCNSVVFSVYQDNRKTYPLDLRPYKPAKEFVLGKKDPEFKDKITLATEVFDAALERGLEFFDVLCDNWYFNERFVGHIENRGCYWISKARSDNMAFYLGDWYRVDDLVKVIPSVKYKKFMYTNSRGEKRSYYIYGFVAKVKHLGGRKCKIVIAKSSWETTDMNEVYVIVTNRIGLWNEEIFTRYKRRWEIECVFRELKDNFYFDQYQVRSLAGIMRHWHLCFLAYTFLVQYELTGSYKKALDRKLSTIGQYLYLYRAIQSLISYIWISKNEEAFFKPLQLNRA